MSICHQSRVASAVPFILLLSGNLVAVNSLAAQDGPAVPPKLATPEVVVSLPEAFQNVCLGGGGRYLAFSFTKRQVVGVFDISAAKLLGEIPVGDDVFYVAANIDSLAIVEAGKRSVKTYRLTDLKPLGSMIIDSPHIPNMATMGHSSQGPLLLGMEATEDGGRLLPAHFLEVDLQSMKLRSLTLEGDMHAVPVKGIHARSNADGRAVCVWQGPPGTGTSAFFFRRKGATLLSQQMNITAQYFHPADDGLLVYASSANHEPDQRTPRMLGSKKTYDVPAVDGPLVMRLTEIERDSSAQSQDISLVLKGHEEPLIVLKDVKLRSLDSSARYRVEAIPINARAYLLPRLEVLITLPDSNNEVVMRRFRLAELLKEAGREYLLVNSQPPLTTAKLGQTWTYASQVLSSQGGLKYTLDSPPARMQVSAAGVVTWTPEKRPLGGRVSCTLEVTDAQGTVVKHPFEVVVAAPASAEGGALAKIDNDRWLIMGGARPFVGSSGRAVTLLQDDQAIVLEDDGVSVKSVVKLSRKYSLIGERGSYFVAAADATGGKPPSIDFVDKQGKVQKSVLLEFRPIDLALHPTKPFTYVCFRDSFDLPGMHFYAIDETTAKARQSDEFIAGRLAVDPSGRFLYAGYDDLYRSGSRLLMNPGRLHLVPQYGSVSLLMRYALSDPGRPELDSGSSKVGATGRGIRVSADGKRFTPVAGMGTSKITSWNAADLEELPTTFDVGQSQANVNDLAYHPVLPVAAAFGNETALLFDVESGQSLGEVVPPAAFGQAKRERLWFSPDGKSLIVLHEIHGESYLLKAPLRFTPEQTAKLNARPAATSSLPTQPTPAVAVPLAKLDCLKGGLGRSMKATEVSQWFADAVVVIRCGDQTGTGMVVGSEGYVLSCAHCLADGETTTVSYRLASRGKTTTHETAAKVLQRDDELDLALLKIAAPAPLRSVRLSLPGDATDGESVVVISNPGLGASVLDNTVTTGVVSRAARPINDGEFIQFSAAVNPGSSGGPLFNSHGLVIGQVSLKGPIEATAFALPTRAITEFLVKGASIKGGDGQLLRDWVDASSTRQLQALFVGAESGKFVFRRADQSQLSLTEDQLSLGDREIIKLLLAGKAE